MGKKTIGNRVVFSRNDIRYRGQVEDEVPFLEEEDGREFLDLIQYIKWDDGGHSIRLCYYVRDLDSDNEKWKFANRPLTISTEVFKELLEKASKKKWFSTRIK